jgi:hypothetical protein
MGGEAGDRVDVLAGFGPAGGLAAAVDPDGEVGVGESDAAEVVGDSAGLDRAGLAAAVGGGGGGVLDLDRGPGQGGELGVGVGWLVLMTAMQWAFFVSTSQVMLAFTEWRASKVTTVSARSSGASRGLNWRTSLVFAPTSTWAIVATRSWVTAERQVAPRRGQAG